MPSVHTILRYPLMERSRVRSVDRQATFVEVDADLRVALFDGHGAPPASFARPAEVRHDADCGGRLGRVVARERDGELLPRIQRLLDDADAVVAERCHV